jgi:flavin reductase (DIM6/NTAB) family NADH-FMN oxidoreductase RutF
MTKIFDYQDIMNMDKQHRAAFVNSLGGFKSVVLVGTQNTEGLTNLAIFNSLFHIGANPPLCGLIVRPDSVERHTLENILETRHYTINHINPLFFEAAHQTSARYPRQVSEFDATGLTVKYHDGFFAPFVNESHVQFGMTLEQKLDLEINGTILLIGKINLVSFPSDCMQADGFVDLEKAGTITCSGLDSYHTTQKLARLSYAKTDKWPVKL